MIVLTNFVAFAHLRPTCVRAIVRESRFWAKGESEASRGFCEGVLYTRQDGLYERRWKRRTLFSLALLPVLALGWSLAGSAISAPTAVNMARDTAIVSAEPQETGLPMDSEAARQAVKTRASGHTGARERRETRAGSRKSLRVHICGAVREPGVYELPPDACVEDAIARAGGLASEAAEAGVNRAAALEDHQQIYVPTQAEWASSGAARGAGGGTERNATGAEARISINSADLDALQRIPGIGPKTAEAIIREREEGGPFSSVDDLLRVSGIKEKRLDGMRAYICP